MPAQSKTNPIKDTIGVAIIGAGERGIYYVGTRMAELAGETSMKIVTVHDRLPERARLAAEHLNRIYEQTCPDHKVQTAPTIEDAIARPDIDLVLVTTHTNAHREPVEIAGQHGKFIYLDKPISVTLSDAQAIAKVEQETGQPIMMGFTRRYERPWIESIDMARKGEIGSPKMVLLRSVIPYSRYLQLWHRTNDASGGAINDKGSHHLDVLNWIAGARARIADRDRWAVRYFQTRSRRASQMQRMRPHLPLPPPRNAD